MDSNKVTNWAHLAEIASGIAVVLTLIFLVIEVRGNSNLIRANKFDRNIESLVDLRLHIASNDESLKVMADHWGVDSPEFLRRQLLVVNMWSIYEKTYYSEQYGLVGPAEWERFETRICNYAASGLDFWRESIANFLTVEFQNYVTSSCPAEAGNSAMSEQVKINYVEFPSRDIEATKAFFRSAFGWDFVDYGPDYVAFTGAGLDGGFFKSDQVVSTKNGSALIVLYSETLEATQQNVEDAGGSIIKPIFSFPGGRRFHFSDTNGNEYAVWSDIEN